MRDRRVVEKLEVCEGRFFIACSFKSIVNNFERAFAGEYGLRNDNDMKLLWDELVGIVSFKVFTNARIVCNIVCMQVRGRIHCELRSENQF
jgi:hypothetical protein